MHTANDDAAPPPGQADPDAELLRAWANWLAAACMLDLAVDAPDAELEQLEWAQERIARVIEGLPAVTPAGAAVKLKLALAAIDGTGAIRRFVTAAGPVPEPYQMDLGTRLLWGLLHDLDQLGTWSAATSSR
jgi:hypothetical protein